MKTKEKVLKKGGLLKQIIGRITSENKKKGATTLTISPLSPKSQLKKKK